MNEQAKAEMLNLLMEEYTEWQQYVEELKDCYGKESAIPETAESAMAVMVSMIEIVKAHID